MTRIFGEMPLTEKYVVDSGKKWTFDRVQFKIESNPKNPEEQINIQLGKGKGLDIFN
ncbi:hypothetical protein [Flammeovirga pectinis]|uniref:hypothetical protein n=1 Tax=Flammeovirga pectinis TaxID=2494373 RepID=UPI0012D75FCA|nr:hypothetical protein [Flammeovirga pectinis]